MSDPHNSDRDAIDSVEPSLASSALDRTFGAHFGTSTQILPDDLATREAMRQAAHFAPPSPQTVSNRISRVPEITDPVPAPGQVPASSEVPASGQVIAPDQSPLHNQTTARELAKTATSTYAAACELVAIARRDLAEYNQAVNSLTQVLPTATATLQQGGRDGWTQALHRPVSADSVEADSLDEKPKKRRMPRWAIVLIVILLVGGAGVGGFFALGGPAYIASMLAEVDESAVAAVLEQDDAFMRGFASTDYVGESTYQLSDVRITQAVTEDDGSVLVDAEAVLTNEFFKSECLVHLIFVHASQVDRYPSMQDAETATSPDGEWLGTLSQSSATTRAIAGVTNDPDFPEGFSPTFDEASQTCSYTGVSSLDMWFGSRRTSTPYTYTFDGQAWTRSAGEATEEFSYNADALAGYYSTQDGDAGRMTSFRIVDFDASTGAFSIEYKATSSGFNPQTISGVIACQMTSEAAGEGSGSFRQADGFVYAFSGDGQSSGGDGTAHIEGVLGLDGSILFDFSGDYTKPAFLFGNPSNESMEISGSVVKQQG